MLSPDANASSHRRRPSTKIESGSFPSRTARARRSRELSRLVIILDFTLEQFATETQRHGANLQAEQKSGGLLANPVLALCVSVSPCLCGFIHQWQSLPRSASDRKHSKAGPRPNVLPLGHGRKSNPHENASPRLATSACRSETVWRSRATPSSA